ncbi:hypothetical protein QF046_002979 [Microbacterium sp. W4I4]|uniref:hypothetical protein n=1 Tax=Microbacterium sp. W4I4 TaxID=3042295 RepID=UPI002785E41F|nr:hypothetical protein [Microbacterium sp. W4I4]MDQ0615338.1 hypothetical protein [Microbacterium sp. W4I4]
MTEVREEDLGILVDAAEARAAAILHPPGGDGSAVVAVCAKGWVLLTDPETGRSRQLPLPDDSFPFAGLGTSDGRFVTGGSIYGIDPEATSAVGSWISELDPASGQVRTRIIDQGDELIGLAFAEDADGGIWFTTSPGSSLLRWDRWTDALSEPVSLSDSEQYPAHLAIDRYGWVYAGLGTTTRSIIAVPPDGGAGIVLLSTPEAGTGYVRRGVDGEVYGHIDAAELHPVDDAPAHWWRFEQGVAHRVPAPAAPTFRGRGFSRIHGEDPPNWSLIELDTGDRRLITAHPGLRNTRLDYRSEGAELSPFRLGPTGRLHGSTNHPLQLFDADPVTATVSVHGLAPVAEAGGNVCAWAAWGDLLAGVAYTGGHLYLLDPVRAIEAGINPVHLGAFPEVGRPRCAVVDGDTLIWGGYPDYGGEGAGLILTDLRARTSTVLSDEQVIGGQSTTALAVLEPGLVLGGTSIENPGGGIPSGSAAYVYLLSSSEHAVTDRFVPDDNVTTWSGAAPSPDGTVHLVSSDGVHVLVDPCGGRRVERLARVDGGPMAYGGCFIHEGALWTIQERAITRVDLQTHEVVVRHRSSSPLTTGGAVVGRDLLAGSGPRLVRIRGVA